MEGTTGAIKEFERQANDVRVNYFLQQSNWIENERSEEAMADARSAWDFAIGCDGLDEKIILEIHRILMQRLRPDIAGRFRTCNVRVGPRLCPPFDQVPRLIFRWLYNWHSKAQDEKSIKKAHVEFEKVHPFEDGNGRVGRIILNWHRVKHGLDILVIREEERFDYYKWFR